ncbi:bacillithiol biosynthesis deacetylase BshB2 [Oceanobacillus piezotolerans]|uniref:Bacillithiol biosynthesis deacetylase BshB2 n=1 Tax=Oceanobacillus piezotolerans TaxID=2448030 RepID=A0A498DQ02_9BACI|nr:bacillithiol biosynthesis deacetylase BshB2 [Oceanobacillus piezotolerans]RLL46639.1 bacillithiol biosynthesis deacetylase BshB2 [Oceanobacillus piezotolerans]
MEKHVVVIYPHPDDESFGAAGTVAKFRSEGVPVTYLCGTLGEMGRNMGNPTFANRETLPEIRKQELMDACNILDMELEMLGYRDKTIEFEDRRQVAHHIKTYLDKINPSLVITHYPGFAVHPDHNAYGAAAIEAVSLIEPENRPTVWAQAFSNDTLEKLGTPDIKNDIEKYFDKKIKAILAHASQAIGVISQYRNADNIQSDLNELAKQNLGIERFYVWKY